jgi:hypothetical protein
MCAAFDKRLRRVLDGNKVRARELAPNDFCGRPSLSDGLGQPFQMVATKSAVTYCHGVNEMLVYCQTHVWFASIFRQNLQVVYRYGFTLPFQVAADANALCARLVVPDSFRLPAKANVVPRGLRTAQGTLATDLAARRRREYVERFHGYPHDSAMRTNSP